MLYFSYRRRDRNVTRVETDDRLIGLLTSLLASTENSQTYYINNKTFSRDVNNARGVKAKASKPRPETCKATDPTPRSRPRMRK